MKKLFILYAGVALIMTGCRIKPEAGFSVESRIVEAGEDIYFTNESLDAVSYEWDFGDGYISYETHPVHHYNATGTYTVTLTAYSRDDLADRVFMDITVLPQTVVNILVLEYYDEYEVPGAEVTLYYTYDDWYDFIDPVITGWTNQAGEVEFYHVEGGPYYVDIWEEFHDNEQLGLEDPLNVKIDVTENEVNLWTLYVDYYPSGKKSLEEGKRRIRSVRVEKDRPVVKIPYRREPEEQ
ncbi:MAG: PKD domain-containing protein [Bacteroidales bacterium]